MNKLPQKPNALLDSLRASVDDVKDIAADLGEVGLDSVLEDGLGKDLPLVGWAFKAFDIKEKYVEAKLRRNAIAFLREIEQTRVGAMEDLAKKLRDDAEFSTDFTDAVASVLIEGIKPIKATIVGRLVRALAEGRIGRTTFDTLALIINEASVPQLKSLPDFMAVVPEGFMNGLKHGQNTNKWQLLAHGLASSYGDDTRLSPLGRTLWEVGFEEKAL